MKKINIDQFKVLEVEEANEYNKAYAIVRYLYNNPCEFAAYSYYDGKTVDDFEYEVLKYGLCNHDETVLNHIIKYGKVSNIKIKTIKEAIDVIKMLNLLDPID